MCLGALTYKTDNTDYTDESSVIIPRFSIAYDAQQNNKVHFFNESKGGEKYVWHFGDYTSSTRSDPSHTYQMPGVYEAKLIVVGDSSHETKTEYILISEE